jgi:hypothetical protein
MQTNQPTTTTDEALLSLLADWVSIGSLSISRYSRMLRLARIVARRNGETVESIINQGIAEVSTDAHEVG